MMIDKHIFRAYDIRGVAGETLTLEIMMKVGLAVGGPERILVGNDIRSSSLEMKDALIRGLKAKGAKVQYIGTTCFGQTLYAGYKLGHEKILFVTASHLPPEWNGVKMFHNDGEGFSSEEMARIRDTVMSMGDAVPGREGSVENVDAKRLYAKHLMERFPIKRKFKVVVDCGNGSMCLLAPQLLKSYGFDVIELYCDVDPRFPNRPSEPTRENIKVLRERVVREKADIGFAFDGDGDRCMLVDDTGRVLKSDAIGTVIAKDMLKKGKCTIVDTVSCSVYVADILKPLGATIRTIQVGHTFVGQACKKYGAPLGFEESGHIFLPDGYYFDDGMLAVLRFMQAVGDKNVSEVMKDIPEYPFVELTFNVPDDKKFAIIKNLQQRFKAEFEDVNTLDGVKVSFGDAWALVRCSNTSPIIRIMAEAKTKKRLEEMRSLMEMSLMEEIEK